MKIVVDIDDTLMKTDKEYNLLKTNKKLVDKINDLYYNGHTIVVWTGRHWDKLQFTIDQLIKIGVRYDTLLMAKPAADIYIDDKAIQPQDFI
jgi:hypothetical protein